VSYSIDVNVLLYASDTTSPLHEAAQAFLRSRALDPEVLCFAWPTLMSYLRMATHPRIFAAPLSPAAALANVESLLTLPSVRAIAETENFWDAYHDVTGAMVVRGNLVPDAHLVTILRLHGVERLYSRDRDFRKFDSIHVIDPFA
jgi:toxin-antitoxin system PIN domain toxin